MNLPRSLTIRRALRGLRVKVAVPHDGAVVRLDWKAKLGRKTVTIGRKVRRGLSAGRYTITLRPTRVAARALKRRKRVRTTLTVTSTVATHRDSETATIVLRQ